MDINLETLNHYLEMGQGQVLWLFGKIGAALLIVIGGYFISKVLNKIMARVEKSFQMVDATVNSMISRVINYTVFIFTFLAVLDAFGVNTTSIITMLGAAGLAIGLALRETLGQIASGIMLSVIRPFKVNDAIESGDVSGIVRKISLFGTIVDTFDGLYIYCPNSSLWSSPIKNYTRNPLRRLSIVVSIDYGDSIDTAVNVLKNLVEQDERIEKDPAPNVFVSSLGDSGVNLEIRAWVKNALYWDMLFEYQRNVKLQIEAAGLSIPFPQQTLSWSAYQQEGMKVRALMEKESAENQAAGK